MNVVQSWELLKFNSPRVHQCALTDELSILARSSVDKLICITHFLMKSHRERMAPMMSAAVGGTPARGHQYSSGAIFPLRLRNSQQEQDSAANG